MDIFVHFKWELKNLYQDFQIVAMATSLKKEFNK